MNTTWWEAGVTEVEAAYRIDNDRKVLPDNVLRIVNSSKSLVDSTPSQSGRTVLRSGLFCRSNPQSIMAGPARNWSKTRQPQ